MKIALCGYKGKIGKEVYTTLLENNYDVIGVDQNENDLLEIIDDVDLIIDFTNKQTALRNIYLSLEFHKPFIVGTTGFNSDELEAIKELCLMNNVKGIICYNFSIPLNYILKELNKLQKYFENIEYIDVHHVSKIDKLSGTAYLFLKSQLKKEYYEF